MNDKQSSCVVPPSFPQGFFCICGSSFFLRCFAVPHHTLGVRLRLRVIRHAGQRCLPMPTTSPFTRHSQSPSAGDARLVLVFPPCPRVGEPHPTALPRRWRDGSGTESPTDAPPCPPPHWCGSRVRSDSPAGAPMPAPGGPCDTTTPPLWHHRKRLSAALIFGKGRDVRIGFFEAQRACSVRHPHRSVRAAKPHGRHSLPTGPPNRSNSRSLPML